MTGAESGRPRRALGLLAVALVLAPLAWLLWSSVPRHGADAAYQAGLRHFADRRYERALASYEEALAEQSGHLGARRGRAETLIVLGRLQQAIAAYDRLIEREPEVAGHWANRGIARDRAGDHAGALSDYERALALDRRVGEGPGIIERILNDQPRGATGIAERAGYLRAQLALPPDERLLRIPALDRRQRPHKM